MGKASLRPGRCGQGGGDGLAQFVDARAAGAGGGDDVQQVGIFVFQLPFIESQGVFILFVDDDDHGGVVAEAGDQLEPMAQAAFLLAGAGVDDHQVETAAGEEELVGGLIHALPAKIPQVEGDGSGGICQREYPFLDVDACGFALRLVWRQVVEQAASQGRFAHAALPHQEQFGLMQWAALAEISSQDERRVFCFCQYLWAKFPTQDCHASQDILTVSTAVMLLANVPTDCRSGKAMSGWSIVRFQVERLLIDCHSGKAKSGWSTA